MDDVFSDDITVPATDGYPLAATLFLPRGAKRHAVLINSATAVPRKRLYLWICREPGKPRQRRRFGRCTNNRPEIVPAARPHASQKGLHIDSPLPVRNFPQNIRSRPHGGILRTAEAA